MLPRCTLIFSIVIVTTCGVPPLAEPPETALIATIPVSFPS